MTMSSAHQADASTTSTSTSTPTATKEKPPPPTDDTYEDAFDAGLFLNEEYVTVSVPVEFEPEAEEGEEGGKEEEGKKEGEEEGPPLPLRRRLRRRRSLSLEVSEAASTDFDLTGQVLWPAATLLSDYLVNDRTENRGERPNGPSLASSCEAACELGAGLGLSGLAAVAFSGLRKLFLTDGSDIVLRVLSRNAERVARESAVGPSPSASVSTALLEWGDRGAAEALLERCFPSSSSSSSSSSTSSSSSSSCSTGNSSSSSSSSRGKGFDLLLGADVAYSLAALPALFETAAALLARRGRGGDNGKNHGGEKADDGIKTPTFLLGYVSRSAALDRAVPAQAENAGFDVEVVQGTRRRLPGGQEGWILSLTLKKES